MYRAWLKAVGVWVGGGALCVCGWVGMCVLVDCKSLVNLNLCVCMLLSNNL
jgi:hypothetical protein